MIIIPGQQVMPSNHLYVFEIDIFMERTHNIFYQWRDTRWLKVLVSKPAETKSLESQHLDQIRFNFIVITQVQVQGNEMQHTFSY